MLECLGNEKLEPRTVDRGQTGICTEPDKSDKLQIVQKLEFKAHIYNRQIVHSVATERRSVLSGTAPKCVIWHSVSFAITDT